MKYDIIGKSKYGTEVIDTASDLKEAEYLVKEYRKLRTVLIKITYKINK